MKLHSVTPLTTVKTQERLLNHTSRQQSRNRQRSILMRAIQQIAAD